MIAIREPATEAELDDWRRVRLAVLPNERAPSVDDLRAGPPERRLAVAYLDGRLAGAGLTARSDTGGAFVQPRVLPEQRGCGVGAALLRVLAAQAAEAGHTEAGAHVEELASLGFAERFGFRETDRQVEQVRSIRSDEAAPEPIPGIDVVPLAGRPDLSERLFEELAREAVRDFALERPVEIDAETWKTEWLRDTSDCFVAIADGVIVGLAGYEVDADQPSRAEHALTAVRRDLRRRGIARMLKQVTIRHAAECGLAELYTWTQQGNEAMRAVNRSLGYVERGITITVRGPVPVA